MFGLMRAKQCGQTSAERNERRLNYCGMCKTLGSLYGQKSRLLLNHDTVFLAELLAALSGEPLNQNSALNSYNCLRLPRENEETPLALQFAATANVVLAEFKTDDQLADSNGFRWRAVKRVFNKSFRQTEKRLKQWRFPFQELRTLPREQADRETAAEDKKSALTGEESLIYLAEPTARATALFFEHGSRLVEQEQAGLEMRRLGFAFGEIVYLLDALTDYEKDLRSGEFNALQASFGLNEKRLPNPIKRKIENLLRAKADEAANALRALPLSREKAQMFAARLNENLSRHFTNSLPVQGKICRPHRRTVSERWQTATARSRDLIAKSKPVWWQAPLAFATVSAVAFVAPQRASEAKSWRECSELGFNLMFLSATLGAVVAIGKQSLMSLPEGEISIPGNGKKQRSGWCDGCDCGGCCGEGCCDGCCCCCDGCDCCGCDCGS